MVNAKWTEYWAIIMDEAEEGLKFRKRFVKIYSFVASFHTIVNQLKTWHEGKPINCPVFQQQLIIVGIFEVSWYYSPPHLFSWQHFIIFFPFFHRDCYMQSLSCFMRQGKGNTHPQNKF